MTKYLRDLLLFTIICVICAAAFGFFAPMVPVVAAECGYVWHDHYKTNYRIRHTHKICGSVAQHYNEDDPFSIQILYVPEFYLEEVEEGVKNRR